MKIFADKKSEALTIILIVLILALFVGWIVNFNSRECRSNSQCPEAHYCGSDFSCHPMPTVTSVENNLMIPSIILGAAIVVAALILKNGFGKKKAKQENHQESQDTH